jgi:hypothetical protein
VLENVLENVLSNVGEDVLENVFSHVFFSVFALQRFFSQSFSVFCFVLYCLSYRVLDTLEDAIHKK